MEHSAAGAGRLRGEAGEPGHQAVRLWLFGGLSVLCPERPLTLEVPPGITVGELLGILGRRLGAALLESVMETPSRKFSICRVFIDGMPVDLDDRLPETPGGLSDFELIVLTAAEGG
ncbi:MoaD/ThiS family protein [Magnetospirillum sp. 15-1]|uniref:MoaD/ThiS family protein n=1 Tax=Magnetospirillum sp. 15-1 TaxID=1979370 RepID=UPI0011433D6A|nr:MoaD/ThiS family protein [Magnetospirillum sp. 15-1]